MGYGLAQPGIFRTPYPLSRTFGQQGGNTDPLAALIGGALGSYQNVKEKQQEDTERQQALDRQDKAERDAADFRRFQEAMTAYNAGLTTTAPGGPTPEMQPQGATTQPHMGAGDRISSPMAPPVAPSPVMSVNGQSFYRAGPSVAERKTQETEEHQRQVAVRVGHALASQYLGHDVDDVTAEGFGRAPGALASLQRPAETPQYFTDDQGNVTVSTGGGPGRPVPGVRGHTKEEPGEHLTAAQQAKYSQYADFGTQALAGWKAVERERQANPNVEAEVGTILTSPDFAKAIPGFRSSADMVTALQKAKASPAAQRYMRAKWSFYDGIARTRYQGRVSGPLFAMMGNEFLPGLDTQSNAQMRQNEIQALLSAQGEAGFDDHPEIWGKAAKRHGVDDIDLSGVLSGGTGNSRMSGIRMKYR